MVKLSVARETEELDLHFFLSFVVLVVPEGEMTEGQCYRVTRNDKACDF